MPHFPKFHIGEFGFDWAAPSKHINVGYGRLLYVVANLGGKVGFRHFSLCFDQNARYINGDVAIADNRDRLGVEVRLKVCEVRMPIIPANEFCRANNADLVVTRNP